MKKVFLLLLIMSFWAVTVLAQENPWNKKLPFESAVINYELSGTMKGKKSIYMKDYGRSSAEYNKTSMKILGMTQQHQEIIITTPDWKYTIDPAAKTGTKQANPKKYMTLEYNKLSRSQQKKMIKNAEKLGISMIERMNGTLEKNAAKILGYACDKTTITGTVVYTISGTDLPLKSEGNTMGIKVSEVATSIKKGRVPSSKFKLPSHILFEHNKQVDQMMQAQAKTAIQNLLAGKHPVKNSTAGPFGGDKKNQNQLSREQQEQLQQMMKALGGQGG